MISVLLNCFKTLLVLVMLPLEFIIKLVCVLIAVVIGLLYVLFYPLLKTCDVPQWLESFCKYSTKIKGSFKLTKYTLDLWT